MPDTLDLVPVEDEALDLQPVESELPQTIRGLPRNAQELAAQNFAARQQFPILPSEVKAPPVPGTFDSPFELPKAEPKEGEPAWETYGKEAYNLAKTIPEFATSLPGLATMILGPLAPRTVAGAFSGGMFTSLGKQIINNYKNWDKMSETQKRVALVDLLGTGLFAGLTGKAAATPKVTAATYTDPKTGETTTAPNHIEAAAEQGAEAPQSREGRETKDFGYQVQDPATGKTENVTRSEGTDVARESGQLKEEPERGNQGHSDQIKLVPASDVGPGMGGALAEGEIVEGTALKNATADLERAGIGLPEAYPTVRQNMARAWIRSGETEAKAPGAGKKLADDLIQNPERGLTDEDSALLLRHKVSLFNEMNAAAERTNIGTKAERAVAQAEHAKLAEQYGLLLDAVKFRGSQWGREGRWRQAMAKEDYDFSSTDGMNRYFRSETGKDMTPEQIDRSGKKSKVVKDAEDSLKQTNARLANEIDRGIDMTEAEKRAYDAANRTVREYNIRLAKAENAARVADVELKREVQRVQQEAAKRAEKASTDLAKKRAIEGAKAENAARIKAAEQKKAVAEVQLKAAQRAQAAIDKRARTAAAKLAEAERKAQADPIKRVWDKAKEYLDTNQGVLESVDQLVSKVATDLGMKREQVLRTMAQNKRLKFLTDEAFRKQQNVRLLQSQAKQWVRNLSTPGWIKFISAIPRTMFNMKIGFGLHGFVAEGTHAPMVAFQPRFWDVYAKNYVKMQKMVFNTAYHEKMVGDLVRGRNYIKAQQAGLVNNPFEQEELSQSAIGGKVAEIAPEFAEKWNKFTGAGNRGYSILKFLRQDMFDQLWDKLPKSQQIPEVAKAIATGINHSTGVTKTPAPKYAHIGLFAPRLEASRVAWLSVDPAKALMTFARWSKATPGEKAFARYIMQERAWVAGTMFAALAINQGLLSATGSKQKVNLTDPTAGDFLHFKVAGLDVSYGNPMISMAKLPMRVGMVGASGQGGKLSKVIPPDERAYDVLGRYARSQASPFVGLGADLVFRQDPTGRPLPHSNQPVPTRLKRQGITPYTWTEFATETVLPIPAHDAIKDVWKYGLGMSDTQIKEYMKAFAKTAFMAETGGRVYEDKPPKGAPQVWLPKD